jgi:HEAT repeat protein
VATEAAILLGRLGDRRAVGPLLALLRRRNQTEPAVLRSLAALAPREAVAPLVAIAADPSRELRRLALEALLAAGDPRSVVVLDRALADPEPVIAAVAARLAGRLRARTHSAALAGLLAHADGAVRTEAARALGAVGGAEACAALARAAAGSAEPVLAEALEASAAPECVPALLAALRAAGPGEPALVRGLAAAVPAHPGTEVVRPLLASLDGDPITAEAAAEALAGARLSHRQTGEVLGAFDRGTPPVRARLCPVLASSAGGRARLGQALGDEAEADEVRAAAAWALAGASEPGLRAALERARTHLHPAIAANAGAALGGPPGTGWAAVQLRGPAGRPTAGQWLWADLPGGRALWGRTGAAGRVRWSGLSGPVTVHAAGQLGLEHPGDGLGKISGDEVPAAQGAGGLAGAEPVQVDPGPRGVQGRQPLAAQGGDHPGQHVPAPRRPQ